MARSRHSDHAGTCTVRDILRWPVQAGLLSTEFFLAYMALTFMFGVLVSLGAVLLEEMELRRYPNPDICWS